MCALVRLADIHTRREALKQQHATELMELRDITEAAREQQQREYHTQLQRVRSVFVQVPTLDWRNVQTARTRLIAGCGKQCAGFGASHRPH